VRLRAVQMHEQDLSPVQVAYRLRVSTKSAYQWRRRWRSGGEAALASKGPGGAVCRLDQAQLTGADIEALGEEHGHRVLRVCGKGTKIVLVPLPPAICRAIDRATGSRGTGPVLLKHVPPGKAAIQHPQLPRWALLGGVHCLPLG
jgi:hypothetical protein